ncbi:hypothetical protein H6P81_012022 [Aristolochia fimbriata]|uniref:Uncharacterized protein n=1 Tax=Aristolochia fimbriata TaxID=158543 RepID=A0AAV7EB04_ARIFI|nr:hypothetical protein H6P81_012022 [Aristolochia fimbriata]
MSSSGREEGILIGRCPCTSIHEIIQSNQSIATNLLNYMQTYIAQHKLRLSIICSHRTHLWRCYRQGHVRSSEAIMLRKKERIIWEKTLARFGTKCTTVQAVLHYYPERIPRSHSNIRSDLVVHIYNERTNRGMHSRDPSPHKLSDQCMQLKSPVVGCRYGGLGPTVECRLEVGPKKLPCVGLSLTKGIGLEALVVKSRSLFRCH